MSGYRRRECASCGADISGAERDYAYVDIRMHHGRDGSETLLFKPLCPECAEEAAAVLADRMGVGA